MPLQGDFLDALGKLDSSSGKIVVDLFFCHHGGGLIGPGFFTIGPDVVQLSLQAVCQTMLDRSSRLLRSKVKAGNEQEDCSQDGFHGKGPVAPWVVACEVVAGGDPTTALSRLPVTSHWLVLLLTLSLACLSDREIVPLTS